MIEFALEHRTLSPSKLAEVILNRRNAQVSSESVTMYFKRHEDIYRELRKRISEVLPTAKCAVDSSIFERENFRELSSVKAWMLEMKARELLDGYMKHQVRTLKSVCIGKFPTHGIDLVSEGKWCFKHPDRLNLSDAVELLAILKDKGIDTHFYKSAVKDFLISKGIVVGRKIAVGKSKSYGKLARLYVERTLLNRMLSWIAPQNFKAFVADDFMFKTGTRLSATLNALIENISKEGHTILVYDKGRRSLYQHGKEWQKHMPTELWKEVNAVMANRKTGRVFRGLDKRELGKLNRHSLKLFVPELEKKIRMPNHFWRHMFFQHMLRATDWNYAVCAELGGSTIASLQESYGKPPETIVRQWGLKYLPSLEASEDEISVELVPQNLRRGKRREI